MKTQTKLKALSALLKSKHIATLLLVGTLSTNVAALPEKKAEPKPTESIAIEYNQGLITAAIKQIPFSKVMQTLEEKTGVHFELNSSAINNEIITATFENLSIQEGIRNILYGYSYATDNSSGKNKIIILTFVPKKVSSESDTITALNTVQNYYPIP